MDILLLVAAERRRRSASIGRAISTMDARRPAQARASRRHVAPFVYTGVGIVKPELFDGEAADVFRLAPFFSRAAEKGRLYGVRLDGLWLHVGRPETIARGRGGDRAHEAVEHCGLFAR